MERPKLDPMSLTDAMNEILSCKPSVSVTMSPGQWDHFLKSAYDAGHKLIEVDENEMPIRAYRKKLI